MTGSRAPLLLVLAVLLAGCGPKGPKMTPVRGTVTLDGRSVAKAAVMFMPQEPGGLPATGVTDDQGQFALRTANAGDGATPGRHRVIVSLKETTGIQADKDGLSGVVASGGVREKWIVPKKYSDPGTSGLVVEVQSGMEPVRLELMSQ